MHNRSKSKKELLLEYNVHQTKIHSNEIARVYSQGFLTANPELYAWYADMGT